MSTQILHSAQESFMKIATKCHTLTVFVSNDKQASENDITITIEHLIANKSTQMHHKKQKNKDLLPNEDNVLLTVLLCPSHNSTEGLEPARFVKYQQFYNYLVIEIISLNSHWMSLMFDFQH